MKTQLVKAIDLLKYPVPMVVKGLRGLYEVTKVVAEDGRVTCYRTSMQGSEIATLRKPYDGLFEVVIAEKNTDHLLDTIGALHTRNKGLQKGHATLTRRVQELEAELAAEKARFITVVNERGMQVYTRDGVCKMRMGALNLGGAVLKTNSKPHELSDRAVDAIIADVLKPEQPITAADTRLQADIDALHVRLQYAEARMPNQKEIGDVVHDTVERMLQPGGLLYRGLK